MIPAAFEYHQPTSVADAVSLLGSLGVPGLFSWSCLAGDCCARSAAAVRAPFPSGVRFISVYSRSDEVVRWEACLDPAAETPIDLSVVPKHYTPSVTARQCSAMMIRNLPTPWRWRSKMPVGRS